MKTYRLLALLSITAVASAAVTNLLETQPLSAQNRYTVETNLKNSQYASENYEVLFPFASDYFRGRAEGFADAYNLLHNIDANAQATVLSDNLPGLAKLPSPPTSKTLPTPVSPFRSVRFNP